MNIQFFCPRWGSEDISWDLFCKKVKDAGYDGVEYAVASGTVAKELDNVWKLAAQNGLTIIAQHYDTYEANFSKHFYQFNYWLEKIRPYPCEKINLQTGKDFFSFGQNKKLIDLAAESGLNVVHETHRNKFSFAAHITKPFLEKIPTLKITFDVSHWVCVAESYLADQQEAIELAIARTEHIHARVGYPEGPQVTDPRISLWEEALNNHLAWWDRIIDRKRNENTDLTISPEFGPSPYMVHIPATGNPVSDQWEVNAWMMELLKKRYG